MANTPRPPACLRESPTPYGPDNPPPPFRPIPQRFSTPTPPPPPQQAIPIPLAVPTTFTIVTTRTTETTKSSSSPPKSQHQCTPELACSGQQYDQRVDGDQNHLGAYYGRRDARGAGIPSVASSRAASRASRRKQRRKERRRVQVKRGEGVLSKGCYDCELVALVGLVMVAVTTAGEYLVHVKGGSPVQDL